MRTLLIIGAAFLVLWVGAIYWEMLGVRTLDDRLSVLLNSALGRSETFDLTLAFFSLKPGILLVVLYFLVVIVYVAKRRRRARPTYIGAYLVFLALLTLLSYGVAEVLDKYVTRAGPVVEIATFRSPGDLPEIRYHQPSTTMFPSDEMTAFAMIMFVCLFRFGSRALYLLPAVLLYGWVQITCGRSWPSDVFAGLMLGWLIASCTYVLRVNELYNKGESWIAVQSARLRGDLRRRLIRWDERRRRRSSKRRGIHQVSGKVALEDITPLPAGETPNEHLRLLETEWGLKDVKLLAPPHKGKLFPIVADGKRYAFKLTRKGEGGAKSVVNLLEMVTSLAEAGGVPISAIVPTRSGELVVVDNGRVYYLTEWVEGRPLDPGQPDDMHKVMRLLATLHKATLRMEPPAEAQRAIGTEVRRIHELHGDIAGTTDSILSLFLPDNSEGEERSTLLEALTRSEFLARLANVYALEDDSELAVACRHSDPHPMNYLIGEGDRITLLDFDRMRYGLPVFDLPDLMQKHLLRMDWNPEYFIALMETYRSVRPMARWEMALLLAWVLLPRPLLQAVQDKALREGTTGPPPRPPKPRPGWSLRYGADEEEKKRFLAAVCEQYNLRLLATVLDELPAPFMIPVKEKT